MKAKHVVILTFPLSDTDGETIASGKALFVKHARKNILGLGDTDGQRTLEFVADKLKPTEAHAADAWLIQMKNSTALRDNFDASNYQVLAQTAPFPPAAFDQDLGVYIVGHNQSSVVRLAIGPSDVLPKWTLPDFESANQRAAAGFVNILQKLGVVNTKKLVLVMCKPVEPFVEQWFLTELVIKLHQAGSNPTSSARRRSLKHPGEFEPKFREMTKKDARLGAIVSFSGTATPVLGPKDAKMTKVKADFVQRFTHSTAPKLSYTESGWSV